MTNIEQILSIRLSPNGLYFSLSNDEVVVRSGECALENVGVDPDLLAECLVGNDLRDGNFGSVAVSLDTEKMALVPCVAFADNLCNSYLKINGHEPGADQCAVVSAPTREIVAVMAWNTRVVDRLRESYGERLSFDSPIMAAVARMQTNAIEMAKYGENLYVTLCNEGLEFADCLPCRSIADALYYVETLKKDFGMEKRTIYIYGEQAKNMANQLKKYYKRVTPRG